MAFRQKTERVTIKTVAEDAGVSTSAVSKVLRDAYGVSDVLRAKVQASMARLGYRPHTAARGMRGQTYTLGVHLPDIHNPFFTDIMAGMNSALERTQYQTLVGISQSSISTQQALMDAMIDRQMDGIIFIGPRMPPDMLEDVAGRIPMVLIAHHNHHAITTSPPPPPTPAPTIPSTTTTCWAGRSRYSIWSRPGIATSP